PVGRHRFERDRGADDPGLELAGEDVQPRLRGRGRERARPRARRGPAPGHRSPRAGDPPARAGAAAAAGVGPGRAVRRCVHGADVPCRGDGPLARDPWAPARALHARAARTLGDVAALPALDALTYLTDDVLVKVDRTSMMNSLEMRAPLLDHRVMEWVARLPFGLKQRGPVSKWVLRE